MRLLCIIFLLAIPIGCSESIMESHSHYAKKYGFDLKSLEAKQTQKTSYFYEDLIKRYENLGIPIPSDRNRQMVFYTYLLNETCSVGDEALSIKMTIVESDSNIIGAYLTLESGNPGAMKLDRKKIIFEKYSCEM